MLVVCAVFHDGDVQGTVGGAGPTHCSAAPASRRSLNMTLRNTCSLLGYEPHSSMHAIRIIPHVRLICFVSADSMEKPDNTLEMLRGPIATRTFPKERLLRVCGRTYAVHTPQLTTVA